MNSLEKDLDFELSLNQIPMERTTENDRNPFALVKQKGFPSLVRWAELDYVGICGII